MEKRYGIDRDSLASGVRYLSHWERTKRKLRRALFNHQTAQEARETATRRRMRNSLMENSRPQQLTVTVLVLDLMGFTSISEKLAPELVMAWLNSYMGTMTYIVEAYGGVVDDYAGDGLKANFGLRRPATNPAMIARDATYAVDCALTIGKELAHLNTHWNEQGLPTGRLRIGICTGLAIAGSINGMQQRFYRTVGDTVNIAARLESLDKKRFKNNTTAIFRILAAESTWQYLGPGYYAERMGTYQLRGKDYTTTIYRIFGYEPKEAAHRD